MSAVNEGQKLTNEKHEDTFTSEDIHPSDTIKSKNVDEEYDEEFEEELDDEDYVDDELDRSDASDTKELEGDEIHADNELEELPDKLDLRSVILSPEDKDAGVRYKTTSLTPLCPYNAMEILANFEEYSLPEVCDDPKPGCVYVYDSNKVGDSWKRDAWDWKHNGNTVQPKANPKLRKTFMVVRSKERPTGDKRFQKTIFSLIDNPDVVIVHYTGDDCIEPEISKRRLKKENQKKKEGSRDKTTDSKSDNVDSLVTRALTLEETVETLENYEEYVSQSRAIRPKAGEIYIFDTNIIGDDWKCDGYIWRNSGTRYMPSKKPVFRKSFFFIRTSESGGKGCKDFKKVACNLISRPNIILVHYMGDESVFKPRKHGNRKQGDVPFERTCPSVLRAIKDSVLSENPAETFSRLSTMYHDKPRDLKQIQSLKERLTRPNRHKRQKLIADNIFDRGFELKIEKAIEQENIQTDNGRHAFQAEDTMIYFDDTEELPNEVPHDHEDTSQEEEADNTIQDQCEVTYEKLDDDKLLANEALNALFMSPLDNDPNISMLQTELLQLHKENLKLQEEKLRLDIEKLKAKKLRRKPVLIDNQEKQTFGIEEMESGENIIYINEDQQILQISDEDTIVMDQGDSNQQYVLIQDDNGAVVQQILSKI